MQAQDVTMSQDQSCLIWLINKNAFFVSEVTFICELLLQSYLLWIVSKIIC